VSRVLALLCLSLLLGCAVARVRMADGSHCEVVAISQTHARCCAAFGTMSSVGGAFTGPCAEADGGSMSTTFASVLAALISAAITIAAHGGF